MGFSNVTYNPKKLAEYLNMDEAVVFEALRACRRGGYAKVWSFEDKGEFGVGRVTVSSRKDADSPYETQFQDGFVCFSGRAYELIKTLDIPEKKGVSIIILNCDVRNKYVAKTEKMYTNFYIYDFEVYNGKNSSGASATKRPAKAAPKKPEPAPDVQGDVYDDEDELPF